MDNNEFGKYLKSLRIDKNLRIRDVEKIADVSNAHISMMEQGKRGIPAPETLKKLSKAYDVTYEELMRKAGYIDVDDSSSCNSSYKKLIGLINDFSDEQIRALVDFIEYFKKPS